MQKPQRKTITYSYRHSAAIDEKLSLICKETGLNKSQVLDNLISDYKLTPKTITVAKEPTIEELFRKEYEYVCNSGTGTIQNVIDKYKEKTSKEFRLRVMKEVALQLAVQE